MVGKINYQLSNIQLFSTKFENDHKVRDSADEKETREYSITIDITLASEKWLIAFCTYKVSTRYGEEKGKLVEAVYTITLNYEGQLSPSERASATSEVAGKQAWMMFREYFSMLNNQADLKLPSLPLEPESVEVSESCNFDNFDDETAPIEQNPEGDGVNNN